MNSESNNFDWIERYLTGALTAEQRAAFERRMETDPAFAEDVELHRTVQELVIDQALLDLKAKMAIQYRPRYRDKGSSGPSAGITLSITGIVLLSALTASLFYSQRQPQSTTPAGVSSERTQPHYIPQPVIATSADPTPEVVAVRLEKPLADLRVGQKEEKKDRSPMIQSHTLDSTAADQGREKMVLVMPIKKIPLNSIPSIGDTFSPTELSTPVPAPVNTTTASLPKDAARNCSLLHMAVKVIVQESCTDLPRGRITCDTTTVEGGVPPYRFSLNSGLSFTKAGQFEHLSPGIYYLTIADKTGCQFTLAQAFEVRAVACNVPKTYAFAPEQGETCKFSFPENSTGTLWIFNRAGILVYRAAVRGGFTDEWNGQSNQGVAVTMGSYRFTFQDEKGRNTGGTITLVK